MKKLAFALIAFAAVSSFADEYVRGHYRKDGTYVDGHHRSGPNKTDSDNYGTRGNYNPYTGQTGTQTPSYERPYQPQQPTYGQQCHTTSAGRYVCK